MMKIFRFFGKLIGAILVVVFIFSMFSSIFLVAFTTQLFNPDFYLETFEEEDFFERLPAIAATQIRYSMTYNPCLEDPDMCENGEPPEEGGEGGPPSYFQALSENDWETLLTELLPPDWLENQLHDLVHNLIDSIRSGSEEMTISISLLELKEHLTGESGVEAITMLMKNQPECTQEDLLAVTRILEGKDEPGMDFLTCNPGDDYLDTYVPQFEALLGRSLKDIPDEIKLAEDLTERGITILDHDLPLPVVINFIRRIILISPLLNLFLLLIIASLAVHSFKALRGWWGYPIAIAGLLAAGLSSLVGPAASFMIDRFGLDSPMPGLHEDLIDVASGLALHILRVLFAQARNYALIVLGVGLTIIIVASVLKEPKLKGEKIEDADQESDEIELVPDDGLGGDATEDQEQEETAPPEEAVIEKEKEKEKEEEENKKEKKKGKRKKKKETVKEEEVAGELKAESDSDEGSSEDNPTEDEE